MLTTSVELVVPCEGLGENVGMRVTVYEPDTNASLPMFVVFYGPEYDWRGGIITYWREQMEAEKLPWCRVALLHPVFDDHDAWLSSPEAHDQAIAEVVLPELRKRFATSGKIAAVAGSVGAAAALSCATSYPDAFGALLLQSGSFFCWVPGGEQDYRDYPGIVAFVARVHAAGKTAAPMFVAMTCGKREGNLGNNWLMAQTLDRQGHHVLWRPVDSTHDFESWGQVLDPYLTWLLQACWAGSVIVGLDTADLERL